MRTVWPLAPRRVVPDDAMPAQPQQPRVKVLHVITRFAGGSGGNTLLSAAGMDPDVRIVHARRIGDEDERVTRLEAMDDIRPAREDSSVDRSPKGVGREQRGRAWHRGEGAVKGRSGSWLSPVTFS